MEYDIEKTYKVVFVDDGKTKSPKGNIIDKDEHGVMLKFANNTTLTVYHSQIKTILEVNNDS